MLKAFGLVTAILLVVAMVHSAHAFEDEPNGVEVYNCSAPGLLTLTKEQNQDGLKNFEIGIYEEKDNEIAGRRRVYAIGKVTDKIGKENPFGLSLVGIPEFLGATRFEAYFIGGYTSIDSQKPEDFLLTSRADSHGLSRAFITMDNSTIPGVQPVIRLKEVSLTCKRTRNRSIYLAP